MRNPPRLRRGYGRITAGVFQQTLDGAAFAGERQEQLAELADRLTRYERPTQWVLAQITGSSTLSSNRWEYNWEEIELTPTGVQTRSGGLTSTNSGKAINLCEMVNDGTSVEGPGWNLSTAPTGFELKPISQACVQLWSVYDSEADLRWFFTLGNVLDGECP
jgi:hypothetical protein